MKKIIYSAFLLTMSLCFIINTSFAINQESYYSLLDSDVEIKEYSSSNAKFIYISIKSLSDNDIIDGFYIKSNSNTPTSSDLLRTASYENGIPEYIYAASSNGTYYIWAHFMDGGISEYPYRITIDGIDYDPPEMYTTISYTDNLATINVRAYDNTDVAGIILPNGLFYNNNYITYTAYNNGYYNFIGVDSKGNFSKIYTVCIDSLYNKYTPIITINEDQFNLIDGIEINKKNLTEYIYIESQNSEILGIFSNIIDLEYKIYGKNTEIEICLDKYGYIEDGDITVCIKNLDGTISNYTISIY